MPDGPFSGKVEFQRSTSNVTTITLDGNAGDVSIGGNGQEGDLVLKSGAGVERIRLYAVGSLISIRNDAGFPVIRLVGHNGDIIVGDYKIRLDGTTGDIIVGDFKIRLDGTTGDVILDGEKIRLDGSAANIWLGGHGAEGDLVLLEEGGKRRIHLDAGGGNIWLGGNGQDGDLVLFPAGATDTTHLGQERIHLNGSEGDIILRNADCAEEFDLAGSEDIEPGTVVTLDDTGSLRPSSEAYDKRVAGVISGAGDARPGIVLNRQPSGAPRSPLALIGKVFCRVDAQYGAVGVGDLLTTSPTPGHAMKALDPARAFGAVIGKALGPLDAGQGLVPILVALQ